MISFSTLGLRSRLGNHLFQYAFLRTTAQRLGVQFYCPAWSGDSIFELNDSSERSDTPIGIQYEYAEPLDYTGLNDSALQIKDGTNIQGYFQTEQYFNADQVRHWYRFKPELISSIKQRFSTIDFSESCGLHVRMGDFVTTYADQFYVPRVQYYQNALKQVTKKDHIIVFSDDIPAAKTLLGELGSRFHFIDGYEPDEGIYLQSLCHDFICTSSTYGWWGAWLNTHPDKVIVAPAEGPFRPGSRVNNHEFWPNLWLKTPGLRFGLDHRYAFKTKHFVQRALNKTQRIFSKITT